MSIICTYWIIMFNYRPRWAFSNNLLYYPSLYGCLYIYIYLAVSVPCFHARILNCNLPFYLPLLSSPPCHLPPALVYYETLAHVGHYFSGVNNYKYYYRFVRLVILLRYYCHSKSSQIINNKCIQISRIEIGLYTSNSTTTRRHSHMFCSTDGKVFRF